MERVRTGFVVKMSVSPYCIPDKIMRREEGKTVIERLENYERRVFDTIEEAEKYWRQTKKIGNTDLWCD